ncbi:MAG: carbohydrate porin, partial [Verrucomicrobiota bacterium]
MERGNSPQPARTFSRLGRAVLLGSIVAFHATILLSGEPLFLDDKAPIASEMEADSSFWTRETLLGDWGGFRTQAASNGISWDVTHTSIYAGVFEGDARDKDFDWVHRFDALVRGSTEQLGLWKGGGYQVHLETTYGEATNRSFSRTGGLWPANSATTTPLGEAGNLVATSLFLTQKVGEEGSLIIGKINALDLLESDPFFGGWGRDRFSNLAFVAPPSGVVPPVIMGAIYNYHLDPVTITFMAFDPNDWTGDYWPTGLFDEGVNLSLGATWAGEIAGRSSTLGVSATYSTQEGIDLRDLLVPPGLVAGTEDGAYNVSLSASHLFWESPDHLGKGLGLYLKAAIADGNPNPIESSVIGGVAAYGLCASRPDDVFGIGYYHYDFSNALRFAAAPLIPLQDETGVEFFYNLAVTPWFHVTADLQWIRPIRADFRNTWAGG